MEDQNIKNAFFYINSFKRHRALFNIERAKQDSNKEMLNYHELKMYQFIENLELAIRALNKENRESGEK